MMKTTSLKLIILQKMVKKLSHQTTMKLPEMQTGTGGEKPWMRKWNLK